MSKLKIKKPQMIACVLLVIAAIICGAVGMYGMSSRSSEKGNEILSNMRLQAILDTAGTGAVDAYVAAAKTEATAKVREEGGGMSEIRDASTKAEEEARALAEQEGIGSVDLSEIDTAPLAESLNVLADAQKAYFAEKLTRRRAILKNTRTRWFRRRRRSLPKRRLTICPQMLPETIWATWKWRRKRSICPALRQQQRCLPCRKR